jgi:hypothetical protein
MTLQEAYKLALESAERWWEYIPLQSFYPKKWMFYRDMMQDLRAMQKTDEHIWHEFLTEAYLTGYLTALADRIEDAELPEYEREKVTQNSNEKCQEPRMAVPEVP